MFRLGPLVVALALAALTLALPVLGESPFPCLPLYATLKDRRADASRLDVGAAAPRSVSTNPITHDGSEQNSVVKDLAYCMLMLKSLAPVCGDNPGGAGVLRDY
jgi:hypothetical protein